MVYLRMIGLYFFNSMRSGVFLRFFLGNVARRAWQAAVFVLRAFQNNLDSVAFTFLCHDAI